MDRILILSRVGVIIIHDNEELIKRRSQDGTKSWSDPCKSQLFSLSKLDVGSSLVQYIQKYPGNDLSTTHGPNDRAGFRPAPV